MQEISARIGKEAILEVVYLSILPEVFINTYMVN
jgi:hypothetical protein